jgi:hypothetical protein
MRTKTLILTTVATAAGIASSLAQGTPVFSVNAVGYVNVKVAAGPNKFTIIANPLNAPDNKIPALWANPPEDVTVYKFNGTGYVATSFSFGEWSDPNFELAPGEAAFVQNPTPDELTITFVGEVLQGATSNPVPQGLSMRSSKIPQTGLLQTDLKYTPNEDDTVYQFNTATQSYNASSFAFGAWDPAEPTVAVGTGFFLQRSAAGSWDRTFNVNTP